MRRNLQGNKNGTIGFSQEQLRDLSERARLQKEHASNYTDPIRSFEAYKGQQEEIAGARRTNQ